MSVVRLTSRIVAGCAVLAVLLGGCGLAGSSNGGKQTVTLPGAYGSVTVPVTARNVWALDPTAAVELLALGVVPTHAGRYTYQGDAAYQAREQILADAGVDMVAPDKLELIAKGNPDLVIGFSSPSTDDLTDDLGEIAPVLIVDGTAAWHESLATIAKATGRQDKARQVIDRLNADIGKTRARIEETGHLGTKVSMISACGAGGYCVYGNGRTAGNLLTSLGFTRPAGQDRVGNESGFSMLSAERIDEHVAPIVFVLQGSVQFGAASPLANPLYDVSGSVTGEVDFGAWFGAGSFDVPWILNDIRAILLSDGKITTRKDAPALFAELAGTENP